MKDLAGRARNRSLKPEEYRAARRRCRTSACSASRTSRPSSTRRTPRSWRSGAGEKRVVVKDGAPAVVQAMTRDPVLRPPRRRRRARRGAAVGLQGADREPDGACWSSRPRRGRAPSRPSQRPVSKRRPGSWMPRPSPGMTGDFHGRPIRHHRHRRRSRRLRRGDPGGAARVQDRRRRARASRRHLPQLGLHPDQGAAALGRDLPLHAARRRLRPLGREGRIRRGAPWSSARAAVSDAAQRRRRHAAEEEQGRRDLGRGDDPEGRRGRRRQAHEARRRSRRTRRRRARWARGPIRPSTSSSRPARGPARCRASSRTAS